MEGRDRRVMILGVVCVLVSVSLGAAFATGPFEPPDFLPSDYVADWTSGSNSRAEPGSNDQVIRFNVPEHNITTVTVRLTWTDDEIVSPLGRRDDTLSISVEGPSTLDLPSRTESGTSGELVLEFDIADVPLDTDVGNMGAYDDANATGEWKATVSVQASGLRDTGNDWTLTLSYTFYTGRMVENPEDA